LRSAGIGKLNFDSFCQVAVHFLDEDDEVMQKELKEAFRLYDKEGKHTPALFLYFATAHWNFN
jgi:Ca2+-binding EF-hand superfamily protein